ncbi:MAG: hypothetical protein KH231_06170 [Dialister sp.]|uniref:hypothetical protein n=1 Tax=Dialister sp. TaxID=1955814 RepID=UPI001E06FC6F|nr:hypothetical protein [Dialister sp.]MBS6715042.1 hypothetical protein [Dialister sp.]
MKTFEISKRKSKNGRRKFKAILHEIYPDDSVDVNEQAGTVYNENGITWLEEPCKKALPSIKDMSFRVEFLDEDRTEIAGHGETGYEDGLPIFEDADVIGHFTKGYIDTIEDVDGQEKRVCIGEGYVDEMCYKNFVNKLMSELNDGKHPYGSVEIYKTDQNDAIVYRYGYKDEGRIPEEFIYSGYALLGVRPADKTAKILELNNKEDESQMTEQEIKGLVSEACQSAVTTLLDAQKQINEANSQADQRVAEANARAEQAVSEKNEAVEELNAIKQAMEQCQKERDEKRAELDAKYEELDALNQELNALKAELGKAQAAARISEMEKALEGFSEEEKAMASSEINAFKEDPINSEINTITDKIYSEIGKSAKKTFEKNSAESNYDDIFSPVVDSKSSDYGDIF